ncbi:potassium channel family protein [Euzebya pacifica]|uniref:potassium channel family protein n=1 Tax=Euzebya pacifica TaxID=1608957 RepID=UPI0030FB36F3
MGRLAVIASAAAAEVRTQINVDDMDLDRASSIGRMLRWAWEALMIAAAVLAVLWFNRDDQVAVTTQWAIWGLFLTDYLARLAVAQNRRQFVRTNVIDLVAIIPLDLLRGFRALRVLRIVRSGVVIWRVLRTTRDVLTTNHTGSLLIVAAGLVVVGGTLVSTIEPGIDGIGDGVWWAVVTATTVGYGDISPVTGAGRGIATLLMLTGIGVLGSVTGAIATYAVRLGNRPDTDPDDPDVAHTITRLTHWDELTVEQRVRLTSHLAELAADPSTGPDTPAAD